MGLWDVIKRSFQRETAKAAVKASASAVATAAETAADGLLSEAEAELASAEKNRAERDDGVVLPSTEVADPQWLADLKEQEDKDKSAPTQPDPVESSLAEDDAENKAKAELEALKAQLLNIDE